MKNNTPDYYKGDDGFDVIDIIKMLNLNFNLGNVLKYIVRAGKKTPDRIQDLEKAAEYLRREMGHIKKIDLDVDGQKGSDMDIDEKLWEHNRNDMIDDELAVGGRVIYGTRPEVSEESHRQLLKLFRDPNGYPGYFIPSYTTSVSEKGYIVGHDPIEDCKCGKRKCANCDKKFKPKTPDQITCSFDCAVSLSLRDANKNNE